MAARPSMLEKGELSRHSPDTARTEFAAPAGTTLRTKCPPPEAAGKTAKPVGAFRPIHKFSEDGPMVALKKRP